MKIDYFIPFAKPMYFEEVFDELKNVLKSGWISKGPRTIEFENELKEYLGVKYAVAVNSCTAALHLSLVAYDIGVGDEVLLPTMTFASTANVITHVGATPVFVDINSDDLCIDVSKIEEKITNKTKAIIPVHYGGNACEMDKIMELAEKYNLIVIEDAAHSFGTKYKGKHAGTIAHTGAYSFYATKNLTTGEGGLFVTSNEKIAERVRMLSLHGMSAAAWKRYGVNNSWYYDIEEPGFKYNMTDIQAAMGLVQLKYFNMMQEKRDHVVKMYTEGLKGLDGINLLKTEDHIKHANHLFVIKIDHRKTLHRDKFFDELKMKNIGTSVHFIPLHMQKYYKGKYGYNNDDFQVAEKEFEEILSLPLYPGLKDEEVKYIIEKVVEIHDGNKKKM